MNISKHLAIWTILTVLAVGILSSYIFYRMQFVNEMAKLESLGATVGGIVEAGLDNYMMARDISILNDTLHKLEKMEAINRILLLNKEGTVKFSTDKDKVGVTLDRHGPKCGGCHENGKKGLYLREEKVFRWIQPIRNKEGCFGCHDPSVRINGLCIIDLSVAQWEKDVWKQALVGFAIFIPSLVIISFIMLFLSKVLIIARLSRITESLQKFRAGDYEVRIPVERNDEITALVKGFNEMTETVSERRKERALWESAVKRQIHFLQLMIDTIPMPVFFKDLNGKYQGCNKSFKTLLGLTGEEIIGKTVYDLCPKEFADKYTQMDIELFENPGVQVYEI
jgi:HAMP domain-containing protein